MKKESPTIGRYYVDVWINHINVVERWYGYEIVNAVMTNVSPKWFNFLGYGFEPNRSLR